MNLLSQAISFCVYFLLAKNGIAHLTGVALRFSTFSVSDAQALHRASPALSNPIRDAIFLPFLQNSWRLRLIFSTIMVRSGKSSLIIISKFSPDSHRLDRIPYT